MVVRKTNRVTLAVFSSFLAGAGFLVSVACEKKKPVMPTPTVVVAEAVQRDVPITEEWIGTLQGSVNAEIRPKVEGFIIKQLYAEGSVVKQGQPLFQIDPRQFKASLDQAKGNLARYEAALNLADITVARYTPLAKENAVSQQELDDALSNQRQAQANVQSAKAALEQAQLNVNWSTITSLIPGIAGTAQIQVGSLVNGQSVLTTVSTVDPIRVVFGIAEQQYLAFMEARKERQEGDFGLTLVLANGDTYPLKGKFIILNRQVDVKTGTIQVEGEFPNPDKLLRPGQYAKVQISARVKHGAILVPAAAVKELQGDSQVAVVDTGGTVEMRSVATAERIGNLWIIDKGLKPGERVVVAGLQMVKSGMKVQATQAPASGAAPPEKAPASSEGR